MSSVHAGSALRVETARSCSSDAPFGGSAATFPLAGSLQCESRSSDYRSTAETACQKDTRALPSRYIRGDDEGTGRTSQKLQEIRRFDGLCAGSRGADIARTLRIPHDSNCDADGNAPFHGPCGWNAACLEEEYRRCSLSVTRTVIPSASAMDPTVIPPYLEGRCPLAETLASRRSHPTAPAGIEVAKHDVVRVLNRGLLVSQ